MEIQISSLKTFLDFLGSIHKFVPCCQFKVGLEQTSVFARNESRTLRMFLTTNSMKACGEPGAFSFNDLSKLIKMLNMVVNVEKVDSAKLIFDGTFLIYDNVASFKLKIAPDEKSEKYRSQELNTELVPIYSFMTSSDRLRSVVRHLDIVMTNDTLLYLVPKKIGESIKVICNIDNKQNKLSDSVGIPISDSIDGTMGDTVCVSVENFKTFNIVNTDSIKIAYTDKNVLDITAAIRNNDYFVDVRIICYPVKQ